MKRFLVPLILSQTQYILCLFLVLRHHLLFPSPIPNYEWFSLFLPYLSICLDVRPPCCFQSFPPAAFVTWGGNSAGLNATVFREGLISRVQTRSFSSRILFPVHSFFVLFLLFPSIFSLPQRIPRSNKLEILSQYPSVAWQQPTSHWLDSTGACLCWTDHAAVGKKVKPACMPTYYNVQLCSTEIDTSQHIRTQNYSYNYAVLPPPTPIIFEMCFKIIQTTNQMQQ